MKEIQPVVLEKGKFKFRGRPMQIVNSRKFSPSAFQYKKESHPTYFCRKIQVKTIDWYLDGRKSAVSLGTKRVWKRRIIAIWKQCQFQPIRVFLKIGTKDLQNKYFQCRNWWLRHRWEKSVWYFWKENKFEIPGISIFAVFGSLGPLGMRSNESHHKKDFLTSS